MTERHSGLHEDGGDAGAAIGSDVVRRLLRLCPSLRTDGIQAERRGDRMMVRLPGERLAWVATTSAAAEALRTEDRVLELVRARCGFAAPTVIAASGDGCSIRSMVPGRVDPDGLAARLRDEPALIPRVGRALARILVEQHTRISEADAAGWLPTAPHWPLPRETIADGLDRVLDDGSLRHRIDHLLDAYADLGTSPQDRALVHTDLGLHNLAFDPATSAVNGVFDFGDAAWADRHLDFRYLVFAAVQDSLLDAVSSAYQEATGFLVNRRRVLVCNAAAAVGHLADRAGHLPDEVVAGRTLAGDLRWTRWALGRAGL